MTDFLSHTPAQAAGLLRPDTLSEDRALWDELKASPELAAIVDRRKSARLVARRELVARRYAELDRLQAQRVVIGEQWEAAKKRRERAEREFRAAIKAERLLPMFAPDGSQLLVDLQRELIETADPRIGEARTMLSREVEVTRAYGAPLEFDPNGRAAGYDQAVNAALAARQQAIAAALCELQALALQALSETEVMAEIERIVASVPPTPVGASMQGRLPAPLPVTAGGVQATRTAGLIGAHDRVAARSNRG